ncbi:hypothetical protein ABI59_09490 [Acidobacteria bacterium Mor1]|nr:hypothetical protein ABI59_09490 [Acidobacteria bacterium Mor1]
MNDSSSGRRNSSGQPIGFDVPGWEPCPAPDGRVLEGRFCRLEPVDVEAHADTLFEELHRGPQDGWTYLFEGPYPDIETYRAWMRSFCLGRDPLFYAIVVDGRPLGVAAYLRIAPQHGSIEVGHIHYAPALRRTPAATEAMYLMMRHAFDDLGYRRYEWKCDALNAGSRRAADRFGFQYEGTFRQALIYRGRNRDTAWFSLLDREWPERRRVFEAWLAPENFDADGRQRQRLGEAGSSD